MKSLNQNSIYTSALFKTNNENINPESNIDKKIPSSTPANPAASTNKEENKRNPINLKVKVKPTFVRKKIDYSQIYTANNFITTVRAFNEFLLKPRYFQFIFKNSNNSS